MKRVPIFTALLFCCVSVAGEDRVANLTGMKDAAVDSRFSEMKDTKHVLERIIE